MELEMPSKIVQFPHTGARASPLPHYFRLADSGVRAIGDLVAAGHLFPKRVVVDASRFARQADLIQDLKQRGVEVVLDTKAAELGSLGKCRGHTKGIAWGALSSGTPLGPEHFGRGANTNVVDEIASFAVRHRVDAVLSPSHWLGDPDCRDWLERDLHSAFALRLALDREGGAAIAIDFPIIAPHTLIRDIEFRAKLISSLNDAPIENVWFRASGLKNGAAPLSTTRHIEAMSAYDSLDRPIVADCIGGLTGLSLLAFGTVSAISHGIGRYDGFDARDWHKEPVERPRDDDGPRAQKRIWLSDLNRSLSRKEVEWLASARGGRKAVACDDRNCCASGLDDMLSDPRRHAARQIMARYAELERVPDLKRGDHFVNHQLESAARKSRVVAKLRPDVKDNPPPEIKITMLMRRMADHADTLDKTRTALEKLGKERGSAFCRAKPVRSREAQPDLFRRETGENNGK